MFKRVVFVLIVVVSLGFVVFTLNGKNTGSQEVNSDTDIQQPVRGKITGVEQGADGVQVSLETDNGIYSVTISVMQAEVFGRFDQIIVGAEIEVSGMVIGGMEPEIIVAKHVKVLGSEVDYVMNLQGTVKQVEKGSDGITAIIETINGIIYQATISAVTSEILYIGTEKEIQEGTVLLLSGELMDLGGEYIVADKVVVDPIIPVDPD
jgi:hypothetical protein